jgi:hypothetical protein
MLRPCRLAYRYQIFWWTSCLLFQIISFFLIGIVGGGVQLCPLGKSATSWPIVPALDDYKDGNLVEWWVARKNEVLGENLVQCHFDHHKSHMTWPGANPCHGGGKPATNRLNYSTACIISYIYPEYRGSSFLWEVSNHLPNYRVSWPIRPQSWSSPPWKSWILYIKIFSDKLL